MNEGLANGTIKPLPYTVFAADEIEQAFRFLATGKHIGKVLVEIRDEAEPSATLPVKVIPQVYFKPEMVYIIAGGLGGFGMELADWMVLRGARKLLLSSKRGISNSYQSYRIK